MSRLPHRSLIESVIKTELTTPMSPHIPIVRSALAFVIREDGRSSEAILAANAACIIAVVVLLNMWTLLGFATAILPNVHQDIERITTPVSVTLFMILLWAVAYGLARREVSQIASSRVDTSPRIVVIYAATSLLAWITSMVAMAVRTG